MQDMDWIVILAIALLSVAFFCRRHLTRRSLYDRARQVRGMRLLVQATVALWAALLIVERGLAAPAGVPFGLNLNPRVTLGVALMLAVAACLWSIRGHRLLRPRRMFHVG